MALWAAPLKNGTFRTNSPEFDMDFFAQQARVRRNGRWLVVLFALAVAAIVTAVDLICAFLLVGPRPGALLGISIAVIVLIALCSLYRVASLRGGGSAV